MRPAAYFEKQEQGMPMDTIVNIDAGTMGCRIRTETIRSSADQRNQETHWELHMVEERWIHRCMDDALLHLIRKLRWIGMESDAEALERVLRHIRPRHSVLSQPIDSD
jgi:hypothetical protein